MDYIDFGWWMLDFL